MVAGTDARSASSRWLIPAFSRASCRSAAAGEGTWASYDCTMTQLYQPIAKPPPRAAQIEHGACPREYCRGPSPDARRFHTMAKAIPDDYPRVTPYLYIDGASAAIDFYRSVLGARERMRMPGPDGKIGHAELELGNSM